MKVTMIWVITMKQMTVILQFLKNRIWKGEANASKKKKEKINDFLVCKGDWKKKIAEERKAFEERIRRGSEDARSSSDESDSSDGSLQVVRRRRRETGEVDDEDEDNEHEIFV